MKIHLASSLLALSLAIAACSGGQKTSDQPVETAAPTSDMPEPPATSEPTAAPTGEPTGAPTGAATTPPPPEKKGWKDMSFDERKKFMATEVMPAMAKTFQEFDAKHFAKFECVTCHGDAGKGDKATFKMPNPKLPTLDPKDNFKKHAKQQKMLDFMMQKVTPQMQQILGLAPFDPAAGTGFGCGNCHNMVKPK
ncbi:MAG: hypothetical protein HOV80_17005 [Polyangiaceae bacterium]|nr:hypothetical protein [Polyangiaceae bacterium]